MSNLDPKKTLADVTNRLDERHKDRYIEKLTLIGCNDPYLLPKSMFTALMSAKSVPNLTYPDIYNYLVNSASVYTHQNLKNFKSLDAYKYFVAGFVKEVLLYQNSSDVFIMLGKVVHSQRLSDTALTPWAAAKKDGEIICAHCTCMAGLGESCSHIAAVLFAVETGVRIKNGTTCTSVACAWMAPSSCQNVEYAEASKVDFVSPDTKLKRLSGSQSQTVKPHPKKDRQKLDYTEFYKALSDAGSKSVVLSVLPDYSKDFVPKSILSPVPNLNNLYSTENLSLSLEDLIVKADEVLSSLEISNEQIATIERETRQQAKSKLWFQHRSGRITASIFKAASRTKLENPSVSLIKTICYPSAHKFSSKYTRWGCEHEATIRDSYESYFSSRHQGLIVEECGLFVSREYPFIGATPDGLISCNCCGLGLLEIKCPYCHRDTTVVEATEDISFCLERVDGATKLKENHQYYFQVQCQLAVTGRSYCDFCVWTGQEMFVQRILPDSNMFNEALKKVKEFYRQCILPELLAKFYTTRKEPNISCTNFASNASGTAVCLCKTSDENKVIIECAGDNCAIGLFHKECMGLKNKRKGWLCPECRVLLKRKKTSV